MLRRSHKKSRDGCRECKRRHVKCDEARPSCRLCVLSERACTYANPAPASASPTAATAAAGIDQRSASSTPSQGTASSSGSSPGAKSDSSAAVPSCVVSRLARPDLPGNLAVPSPARDYTVGPFTGAVNLDHAELLIHCFKDTDLFVLADQPASDYQGTLAMAFDIAHQYPFLLHEILAYSACHLAYRHPGIARYQHLAIDLQTRAVAEYNASGQDITPENCVAVLLFATVIGQHTFADALRPRDFAGLAAFIQRFAHCLGVQKGIVTIYHAASPVLLASPIEKALTSGIEAQKRTPVGTDCTELMSMIYDSPRLTPEEKDACIHAAVITQLGFDDMALSDEPTHLCFKWVIAVRPPLKRLLEQLQPDALVVLAYYALLLHLNRNAWPVGTAGVYIMGMVTGYLGRDNIWLQYPRSRMAEIG